MTRGRLLVRMGFVPLALYFAAFCVLTYPWILRFSTHFFADREDALRHAWGMWWTNKAVTELHQGPWHTSYLHYPYGISLLGHTASSLNGFMGMVLLRVFSLVEAYNVVVIFSFVASGLTAFLLAHYVTRSYWGSLIAGFTFTFSNYHFGHAAWGHLNLVALEWVPVFILSWYVLLTRPSARAGLAAAVGLFAVILSDYYYFFHAVLAAGVMVAWYAFQKRDPLVLLKRGHRSPVALFVVGCLVTTGALVGALLLLDMRDPLLGGQSPKDYSLDLLATLVPGAYWRFGSLTQGYWSRLLSDAENSVYLGMSVVALLAVVWAKRRSLGIPDLGLWYLLLLFFAVMSLGPVLHVWGAEVPRVSLPYAWLERVVPPVRLSNAPARMIAMAELGASIICAAGFGWLLRGSAWTRLGAGLLLALLVVEYWPKPLPSSRIAIPEYARVLKALPVGGGVMDLTRDSTLAYYYQTIHEKPMALGRVSRVPESIYYKDQKLREIVCARHEVRFCDDWDAYPARDAFVEHPYAMLCRDYNIRYLVLDADMRVADDYPALRRIYGDRDVQVYDLGGGRPCRARGPAAARGPGVGAVGSGDPGRISRATGWSMADRRRGGLAL